MRYARRITEDGWFGREKLDADSISELGTTNHELSVWKISDETDSILIDNIALAIALTRSKVEEFYMVLIDVNDIKEITKWSIETIPQDGNTRYSYMKGEHTNFVVMSLWEQGFLSEYIHDKIKDEENYRYYDAAKLKKMAYDAVKNGKLSIEEIKDSPWKKAVKEMEGIYGQIP